MHFNPNFCTRMAVLPAHLQILVHSRLASTAANPGSSSENRFPFPTSRHPTPHQIFHLPQSASKADIKARYYDLVRLHHPDAPAARHLPPDVAHARFHAITSAYDRLLHPHAASARAWGAHAPFDNDIYAQELARRREQHYRRQANRRYNAAKAGIDLDADAAAAPVDGVKERVLLVFGIACLGLSLYTAVVVPMSAHNQQHQSAAHNLARARREAREFGAERREAIRRRVEGWREEREGVSMEDPEGKDKEQLRPEEVGTAGAPRSLM
ncbi:hypothetical protein DENSPDRAFT_414467 [Dentipellis sp. KUC8613]|nr:hypothetical protein DENSPDRAFT_414467 [Dentipellis sp. KUC8613]